MIQSEAANLGSFPSSFGEPAGSVKSPRRFDLWSVRRAYVVAHMHSNQAATDRVGNKGHAEVFSFGTLVKISVWPGWVTPAACIASLFAGQVTTITLPARQASIAEVTSVGCPAGLCIGSTGNQIIYADQPKVMHRMWLLVLFHLQNLTDLQRLAGL